MLEVGKYYRWKSNEYESIWIVLKVNHSAGYAFGKRLWINPLGAKPLKESEMNYSSIWEEISEEEAILARAQSL